MTSADPPLAGLPVSEGSALRVATIPRADAYVDAVLPPGVVRLAPSADAGRWLDPAYLAQHSADLDVLHLHAGLGALPVPDPAGSGLDCWTEAVRRLGVPLVVTVHQLSGADRCGGAPSDEYLEALLSTAEVVLTLTPGAADEIAERFGRTAIVVAHPSVTAPDPELGAERGLVGLRLGQVPDAVGLVRAACSGAVSGGGRLRVLVDDDAPDPTRDPEIADFARRGDIEVLAYRREDWVAHLQQLHVAVLPERCGSHSRDLEICRDVGTRVVAPSCGWFRDQWSEVVSYGTDERGDLDEVSLAGAVSAALTRPVLLPADQVWRKEQRSAVQRVHAEVYAQVAADRSWA